MLYLPIDLKGLAGAILMDLSKAFDFLNHELLIAKLDAYGFSRAALVYDYLSNRKQRAKNNGTFSAWQESIKGYHNALFWDPYYSMHL